MNSFKEYLKKFVSLFKSPAVSTIFRWSKCVHGSIFLICLMNALITFCGLGVTLATKGIIDGAVSSKSDALWRYGIILTLLVLLQRVFSVIASVTRTNASARLQRSLQSMLSQELLDKNYASLKGYHSGELVNRFFSDVNVVKNGVMNILPNMLGMAISFFGAAVILIAMDWRFVILLVIGGILALVVIILFRAPMKARHKRIQEAEGALHANAQETLENIRLIKASVSESRSIRQISKKQGRLEREQIRHGYFNAAMNNSLSMVFNLSWLFCMLWGCVSIFHGRLTYGSLAAMIQLIGRIQNPIANAVGLAGQTYGVLSSAERLMELTALPPEITGDSMNDFDTIHLEDVCFQYDDGIEDVLRNITCTVRRGDFVALTGISGGGKTSLFQLLLGIYRPTSGQVLFCRECAENDSTTREKATGIASSAESSSMRCVPASRATRSLFAYVPQGNTLFSGTLRDNLTMFTDHATDEEISRAVKAACIEDLYEEIGPEAILGERGIGLSEGQAQRVAVARALLSNAPILLLDESTSALDEETEARMLQNISTMRDKTCFIVTHRRAALQICDYQLHIEEGMMKKG